MGIKTVNFIPSFQNFRFSSSLFHWNFHTKSLSSHPMFMFPVRRNLSFPLFPTLLVDSLHRWVCDVCSALCSTSLTCLVFTAFKASYFLCHHVWAQWMTGSSEQNDFCACCFVWLRLSISLEQAHNCKVLQNSCSENTDSRRTGDILGHF